MGEVEVKPSTLFSLRKPGLATSIRRGTRDDVRALLVGRHVPTFPDPVHLPYLPRPQVVKRLGQGDLRRWPRANRTFSVVFVLPWE